MSVALARIVGHPDFGLSAAVFPGAANYMWSRNNDCGGASVGVSRGVTLRPAACVALKFVVFVERPDKGAVSSSP